MAIPQGFAKHHGRGGVGREVGLHQEGEVLMCLAAPKPQVYIGEKGAAPPLGFPTPRGAANPRSHLGGRPRGEECLPSQVEASPFRVFPLPCAWALGGWCPWPIKARAPPYSPCCCIGRGGTFSGPPDPSGILRNLPEASRYNTGKNRTFPGTRTTTFHI